MLLRLNFYFGGLLSTSLTVVIVSYLKANLLLKRGVFFMVSLIAVFSKRDCFWWCSIPIDSISSLVLFDYSLRFDLEETRLRLSESLLDLLDWPKSASVWQTNSFLRRKFLMRLRLPAMPASFIFLSSCLCLIICSCIPLRDLDDSFDFLHALSIILSSLKTLLFNTPRILSLTLICAPQREFLRT